MKLLWTLNSSSPFAFQRNAISYTKSTLTFCLLVKFEYFVVQTLWVMSHSKKNCSKATLINTWHSTFNISISFDVRRIAYAIWDILVSIILINHSCFVFPFPPFANILLLPVPGCARLFLSCGKIHGTKLNIDCYKTIFGSNLHTNAQCSHSQIIKLIKRNTKKTLTALLTALEFPSMGIEWLENFRCETFLIRFQYA